MKRWGLVDGKGDLEKIPLKGYWDSGPASFLSVCQFLATIHRTLSFTVNFHPNVPTSTTGHEAMSQPVTDRATETLKQAKLSSL